MPSFALKTTHKAVKDYYAELAQFAAHGAEHEMAVRQAFAHLLEHCCRRAGWTLVPEYKFKRHGRNPASIDGALLDAFSAPVGYWEAKDSRDDLTKEITAKFLDGYPKDNILFQAPDRAVLWQAGHHVCDADLRDPNQLVQVLHDFFVFRSESQITWEQAVDEFRERIPQAARELIALIEKERTGNARFVAAFQSFVDLCRASINPNLADKAVEEMLVQHLMTERIFRRVFQNDEFTRRNVIAAEIEKVISALTSRSFSRQQFLQGMDRFYVALERRAESLTEYSQKQTFLNTVYEQFFQGFAVKQADTLGIVYTPQSIVDFMVRSVEELLKKEFGRSLSDNDVHILDPFVGTGNFKVRVMQEIATSRLPYKYAHELHCNEIMLLAYYIAAMNIEHAYFERTGEYKAFEGICLVDTFELAEDSQGSFGFMESENTERVRRQKAAPIRVIIGNPPYNAGQVNENDNNKNRKYKVMDKRVAETYAKASAATNKNALSDPYVKAIRWASDRIAKNGEGIVAFVTNNGFVGGISLDGIRKCLSQEFDKIVHVDLKGNARNAGERRKREGGNVFDDSIRVGVGISFFVRLATRLPECEIQIFQIPDFVSAEAKKDFLVSSGSISNVPLTRVFPDINETWLRDGASVEFGAFMALCSKTTPVQNVVVNSGASCTPEAIKKSPCSGKLMMPIKQPTHYPETEDVQRYKSFCSGGRPG